MTRFLRSLALASACLAPYAPCIAADEEVEAPRSIRITAVPSLLPKGAGCRVVLRPEQTPKGETLTRSYEGTIVRASDDGLLLSAKTEESRVRVGVAQRVPIVNRITSSVGIARTTHANPKEVWISVK